MRTCAGSLSAGLFYCFNNIIQTNSEIYNALSYNKMHHIGAY